MHIIILYANTWYSTRKTHYVSTVSTANTQEQKLNENCYLLKEVSL